LTIADETEEEGLRAFLISNTFQAVPIAVPAMANTSSVASAVLSPNL